MRRSLPAKDANDAKVGGVPTEYTEDAEKSERRKECDFYSTESYGARRCKGARASSRPTSDGLGGIAAIR
jgi:hypothetical protein